MTKQQSEERQQRLIEALDRFYEHKHTDDDLAVINYETGLINYRPTYEHQRIVSQ